MNNQLTVLIPTSPIPSHPSTEILDETIAYIRKFTDARIIIMFDGVHESLKHREKDYFEYRDEVMKKYSQPDGPVSFMHTTGHCHQAILTRSTLDTLDTPLIMFVEHDTYIDDRYGRIPFNGICDLVENSTDINYVRFNIFDRILEEHDYLMLDSYTWKAGVRPSDNLILRRTIQYSQRPHIAKTDWYRGILARWFKPDAKTMIEDVMHSVVQERYKQLGYDEFGLAIYTPEGNQLRSFHSDGRGTDEKIIDG